MVVPLTLNDPAVTCASLSNFGRRLAFALLNVALASTRDRCPGDGPSGRSVIVGESARREGERQTDIVAEVDLVAGLDAAVEGEDLFAGLILDVELDVVRLRERQAASVAFLLILTVERRRVGGAADAGERAGQRSCARRRAGPILRRSGVLESCAPVAPRSYSSPAWSRSSRPRPSGRGRGRRSTSVARLPPVTSRRGRWRRSNDRESSGVCELTCNLECTVE